MTTLTATSVRQNLFQVLKKSIKEHVPIRITSKAGDAVLISEEDYEGLIETLEILSTPGMAESIRRARQDIKAGRTKSHEEVFGEPHKKGLCIPGPLHSEFSKSEMELIEKGRGEYRRGKGMPWRSVKQSTKPHPTKAR